MTTTHKTDEKAKAIEQLREMFPPGSTAHTILRHCARSGMTRWISVVHNDEDVSWLVARALGEKANQQHDGIKVGGCGMDMGFHLVYSLSSVLYPDGFDCIDPGEGYRRGCPSNDHSNYRDSNEPGRRLADMPRHHSSGGYAVSQRWL